MADSIQQPPTPSLVTSFSMGNCSFHSDGKILDNAGKPPPISIRIYIQDPARFYLFKHFHLLTRLASILMRNSTLKELDISRSGLGNEGVAKLAEALKHNSTLAKLNIAKNTIGNEGASKLAIALKANHTLTMLDIEQNKIDDQGAAEFAKALIVNSTLTSLNMGQCKIGLTAFKELVDALKANKTLTTLNLSGAMFNYRSEVYCKLLEALMHNSTLTTLDITENCSPGVARFVAMFMNKTIFIVANNIKITAKYWHSDKVRSKTEQRTVDKTTRRNIRIREILDNQYFLASIEANGHLEKHPDLIELEEYRKSTRFPLSSAYLAVLCNASNTNQTKETVKSFLNAMTKYLTHDTSSIPQYYEHQITLITTRQLAYLQTKLMLAKTFDEDHFCTLVNLFTYRSAFHETEHSDMYMPIDQWLSHIRSDDSDVPLSYSDWIESINALKPDSPNEKKIIEAVSSLLLETGRGQSEKKMHPSRILCAFSELTMTASIRHQLNSTPKANPKKRKLNQGFFGELPSGSSKKTKCSTKPKHGP